MIRSANGAVRRWGVVFLLFEMQLCVEHAHAKEADRWPPVSLTSIGVGKKVGLPFVRIAFVQTLMHVGASALWSDGYSPVKVRVNRAQFYETWHAPPEYRRASNIFESDGDWWTFNVFAHGLFGSEGYLAARGLGHGPTVSFLYGLFASTTWEYLVEGFYKQPSAIDLFWTPAFGALLGELRYHAYRLVTTQISNRPARLLLQLILDPLGKVQRVMLDAERW